MDLSRHTFAERLLSTRWGRGALLVTAMSAAAIAAGCGSDSAVTTSPTQVKCQVTLAAPASSIGADGGMSSVTVTTSPECPWDVATAATWLSELSPTSGQGPGTVRFRAAANPQPAVREGEIIVNENRVRVSQQAAACRVEFKSGSLSVDAGGSTREVDVSAPSGCAWAVATDADWISFTTPASGNGDGKVGLRIAANTGAEARSGSLALGDQRLAVSQVGLAVSSCSYAISLTSTVSIAATGGTGTVTVSTNAGCAWTASSSVPWITVTSGGSASGSGAVAFTVAANQGAVRTGTVTVAGQVFPVTQAAAADPCAYTISPLEASLAAAGGTGTVAVASSASCGWTASSLASWITITSGATGTGNGPVGFSVAANSGAARTGTISVADQTFTVAQAAAANPCVYAISPSSNSTGASGGTGTVDVTTTSGCAWTATSSATWITISGSGGTGSGAIAFSVAANSGAARTATISVAGQTFTVAQAAAASPCVYAISPSSSSPGASGGTGTVDVSTASTCDWTATSSATWITITSGASGTGNGPVAFSVAANSGAARNGTLTVAGQTFTVSQAAGAANCSYAITPTSGSLGASGGTGSTDVSTASGCAWTASSNDSWITVTSGASGSGNGRVAFSAAANNGAARSGSLTVAGQTFTVSQAAAAPNCSYAISPTSGALGASGGTGSTDVSTASGCAWTASSNASWLTVTSGASGSGNGRVAFSAAANSGAARSGTLTVAGQTFTVSQAAAAPVCTYTISPRSADLSGKAQADTVDVSAPAGCAWTARSNDSWIYVLFGSSGTGNGTVTYGVPSNPGKKRSGTMTIAGVTFTVNQQK